MIKVAILVDGAFFIKRLRFLYQNKPSFNPYDAAFFAKELHTIALKHLNWKKRECEMDERLYRILYYDCPPLEKRVHNPINMKCMDFSKSPEDFMFQITKDETNNLRSHFATSGWGGSRYQPYAFTEQGIAMLSSRRLSSNERSEFPSSSSAILSIPKG